MQTELRKGVVVPLLASLFAFGAFMRTAGAENVRAVQIVSLLVSGIGLGIVIAHVKILLGLRSRR